MKDCVLIRKKEVNNVLALEPMRGKRQLEPFRALFLSKKIPFGIMEDHEVSEAEAEVHKHEADLWIGLEGKAEFIYGGELVEPWIREGTHSNELGGEDIKGGTKVVLKAGDILYIPAGQPHMHTSSKTARMLIIKIPER